MTVRSEGALFAHSAHGETETFVAYRASLPCMLPESLAPTVWVHLRSSRWGFVPTYWGTPIQEALEKHIDLFLLDLRAPGWRVGDIASDLEERRFYALGSRTQDRIRDGIALVLQLADSETLTEALSGGPRWENEPVWEEGERLLRTLRKKEEQHGVA